MLGIKESTPPKKLNEALVTTGFRAEVVDLNRDVYAIKVIDE